MLPLSENISRTDDLERILEGVIDPNSAYQMGLAVVDLRPDVLGRYEVFGHNMDHAIYPASLSKVFVGAAIVAAIRSGEIDSYQRIEVLPENAIDTDPGLFPGDSRPLLEAGECVTVGYLLDLMLSRSDNTASNVLIDLMGRNRINERVIIPNGWQGSQLTRKYLPLGLEPLEFRDAKPTQGRARHFAEFFFKVATGSFAGRDMLTKYMSAYNPEKPGLWLPGSYTSYYRKGGKHDSKLRDGRTGHYLHDAGIVVGVRSCYVVALMTLDKNNKSTSTFPMRAVAQALFDYMEGYRYR